MASSKVNTELPLSSLYLGLYSDFRPTNLYELMRDNHQQFCHNYSSTQHCRFYGDCCVDPMRVRERLEPGTFSCQRSPAPTGMNTLQYSKPIPKMSGVWHYNSFEYQDNQNLYKKLVYIYAPFLRSQEWSNGFDSQRWQSFLIWLWCATHPSQVLAERD